MRHKKLGRKLGVKNKHRKAMFRNMATDLFRYDKIKTTDTRAKEIRRVAEKIVTLAKDGSLHARRRAASYIKDKQVLSKLFDSIAEKYKDRPGGYTRIIKLGYRKGDNTPMSLVELVQEDYKPSKRKRKTKKSKDTNDTKTDASSTSTKKESAKDLGLTTENDTEKKTEEETSGKVQAGDSSEKEVTEQAEKTQQVEASSPGQDDKDAETDEKYRQDDTPDPEKKEKQ